MNHGRGYKIVACIVFLAVSCLLAVSSAKYFAGAARRAEQRERDYQEQYFLEEIKTVLETEELYKSGVTMTRIEEREGEKEYQVLIHNKHILKMSKDRKEELKKKLSELSFPDGNSRVSHVFLEI